MSDAVEVAFPGGERVGEAGVVALALGKMVSIGDEEVLWEQIEAGLTFS